MKKILGIILLTAISASAFAATGYTPFATIAQAEAHGCPSNLALQYSPISSLTGYVTGNGFSTQTALIGPASIANGNIDNAQFRAVGGFYGHVSGDVTVCTYQYAGKTTEVFPKLVRKS